MNFSKSCALVLSLLAVGSASATGHASWKSVGSGFTISFPDTPHVTKETRNSATQGKLFITRYSLAVPGHVVYMVQDFNAERGFPANNAHGEGLPAMMSQFAQGNGATIVSSQQTTMHGYPGLIVMLQHGQEVGRAFAVQANHHIVVVMAVSNPSEINSPTLSKFLNSFKVTS